MSGLLCHLGARSASNARSLLETTSALFTGPNHAPQYFVNDWLSLVVSSRFATTGPGRSYGSIDEHAGFVIAAEGYFCELNRYAEHASDARGKVLLDLFRTRGHDGFARLEGSFQVAIADERARVCTVFCSRFAGRALYRARSKAGWTFSSEVKALPLWQGKPLELEQRGLCLAFAHGDTQGARTPFRGVERLLPGTRDSVNSKGDLRTYRCTDEPVKSSSLAWEAYVEHSDALIQASVARLSHVTDDPKAVLMGSGIDSAVIAGAVKRGTGRVTIVTQAMPGPMNEAPGASRTARGLEATHHVFEYDPARVSLVEQLRRFVAVTESPAFWAQLAAPMLTLSNAAQGIARTFLLGIMSDNLMEYGSRRSGLRRSLHQGKELIRTSLRRSGSHFDKGYFRERAGLIRASAVERQLAYTRKNLLADQSADGLAELYANQWLNVRTTSKLVQFHGGEALLPYLDQQVIRHFMAMPYAHRHDKKVLLALLHRYMPEESAPKRKTGFCANVVRWHHEADNLSEALDLLTEQRTRLRGIYDETNALRLIERFRRGPVSDGRYCETLYQWLLFELFCRQFLD